jgi:hypothetical protein
MKGDTLFTGEGERTWEHEFYKYEKKRKKRVPS